MVTQPITLNSDDHPEKEPTMQILRTPDERFKALPDYGFQPRYVEVAATDGSMLRVHLPR